MSQAKQGDTVQVHYTGTLDNGEEFDSSRDREPLEFTVGSGQVIPGFDAGVTGMSVGETKEIHIPSTEAYGPRQDELVAALPRTQLPEGFAPEIGQHVQLQSPAGEMLFAKIVDSDADSITVDANHPLAGENLNFSLELVEIK